MILALGSKGGVNLLIIGFTGKRVSGFVYGMLSCKYSVASLHRYLEQPKEKWSIVGGEGSVRDPSLSLCYY